MDPILIIDDERDNLEALKRMLRGQYDVSTTESPFNALRLIQSKLFHVIVSDQRMPEMTGVEFLEKAKKLSPLSTRILLTGYTDIESVIESINRGQIYRYVSKPWEPDELRMTLRQANEAFILKKALQDKNESLEKALGELTLLDKAKARFLSLVSHELNTPLTVLNSFIELLSEQKKELPADVGKAITLIQGASDRFYEIVKDVVEYVSLESDPSLNKKQVNLSELLATVLTDLKPRADLKKVEIKTTQVSPIPLSLDPEKILIALRHLANDTLKRTPANSIIEWSIKENEKYVSIEVIRDGEAIPDLALEALETGQSQMNHQQNLGMGLAVCRTIVDRHGAKMRLSSHANRSLLCIEFPI